MLIKEAIYSHNNTKFIINIILVISIYMISLYIFIWYNVWIYIVFAGIRILTLAHYSINNVWN